MLGQEIQDELWFPICALVWQADMKDSQQFGQNKCLLTSILLDESENHQETPIDERKINPLIYYQDIL